MNKIGQPSILVSPNGRVSGGKLLERLVVRFMWLGLWFFKPFRLRGYWRFTTAMSLFFRFDGNILIILEEDILFHVNLKDPYWNRLVAPFYLYEPELHFLFKKLKNVDYAFIDCGANFGYWSLYVSSKVYGAKNSLAIEASSNTFKILSLNNSINGERFSVMNRAVFKNSNHNIRFFNEKKHANSSLKYSVSPELSSIEDVLSIKIDDIQNDFFEESEEVVVKLDVEGVEIEALLGATRTLIKKPLIIYEDHSLDPESKVSRFVMDDLGLEVFYVDEKGVVCTVNRHSEILSIKSKTTKGYNFLACEKSSIFYNILVSDD